MRTAIVMSGIALALALETPAAAQVVEAGVVIRSGPVTGHVVIADPEPVYHRTVVVERYAPRVIVVDGSRKDPSTTWAAVQSFHARGAARLEYIGDDEAATLRDAIAAEGVPGRVLQWGVTPGDIGSKRAPDS